MAAETRLPGGAWADRAEAAVALASSVAREMVAIGRQDLQDRLRAAVARITRPTTVVCVVGEFKQGKSSLINALLGQSVLPVDDDLATSALTLVYYADPAAVHVRRSENGKQIVDRSDATALPDLVTEQGNPANRRAVQRVDIGLPNAILRDGLALVDTPGAGGIRGGYAAATLAFLGYVDGLIFATDASAELSAPELEFLRQAAETCPTVICALTKTDISPQWRQIADLDRGHLARARLSVAVVPVSSRLRQLAVERQDRDLNIESGFPALGTALQRDVIGPAKSLAVVRAMDDVHAVTAQLTPAYRTELALLEDPSAAAETLSALRAAQERLEHLRGPGARWSQLVGDRMTELSNDANYRFRGSLRAVSQAMDEQIDQLKTPAEWEELGKRLTGAVADAAAAVYATLQHEAEKLRGEVTELLRAESVELGEQQAMREPLDVTALWSPPSIREGASAGAALGQTLTGLRGMQSGIFMMGMVGTFMPAAAAALLLSTPITLGLGIAFAGGQLLDANRRKIAARRQKAKAAVRQFVDEVSFEVGNQLGELIRETQRHIRDEFTDRVTELLRTYSESAQRAQQDLQQSVAERQQRADQVRGLLQRLEQLERQAVELGSAR